jgi:hypothetical protein
LKTGAPLGFQSASKRLTVSGNLDSRQHPLLTKAGTMVALYRKDGGGGVGSDGSGSDTGSAGSSAIGTFTNNSGVVSANQSGVPSHRMSPRPSVAVPNESHSVMLKMMLSEAAGGKEKKPVAAQAVDPNAAASSTSTDPASSLSSSSSSSSASDTAGLSLSNVGNGLLVSAVLDESAPNLQRVSSFSSEPPSPLTTGPAAAADADGTKKRTVSSIANAHSMYMATPARRDPSSDASSPVLGGPRPLLALPRSAISSISHSEQNDPYSEVSSGENAPHIPMHIGMNSLI